MHIIQPHTNKSREVIDKDLELIYKSSEEMLKLLNEPIGMYWGGFALAHSQVEKDSPLRFFVLNGSNEKFKEWQNLIIINPVITRHSKTMVEKKEGCLSFAEMPMKTVQRYNKIEVEFYSINFFKKYDGKYEPRMSEKKYGKFSGVVAQVWQHEINHLDGINIFDV